MGGDKITSKDLKKEKGGWNPKASSGIQEGNENARDGGNWPAAGTQKSPQKMERGTLAIKRSNTKMRRKKKEKGRHYRIRRKGAAEGGNGWFNKQKETKCWEIKFGPERKEKRFGRRKKKEPELIKTNI